LATGVYTVIDVDTRSICAGDVALLALLATGLTDRCVARRLHLSVRTVQRRISELCGTLGAGSRFQLGCLAVHHHLVTIDVGGDSGPDGVEAE